MSLTQGYIFKCAACGFYQHIYICPLSIDGQEAHRIITTGQGASDYAINLLRHKGATFDLSEYLYQCDECNGLETRQLLSVYRYLPKRHTHFRHECHLLYMNPCYEFIEAHQHKCKRCSGNMHPIMHPLRDVVLCPKCGARIYGRNDEVEWFP